MDIIKISKYDEVRYFKNIAQAAHYIGCSYQLVYAVARGFGHTAMGWTVERIEFMMNIDGVNDILEQDIE